jgi:putative transcriptional regulator
MKNRIQLFRKAKHWTQIDLASHVGVNRECIDAIEKGRFLPSVALAYNIAVALEGYLYDVFPPRGQLRARCRNRPALAIRSLT